LVEENLVSARKMHADEVETDVSLVRRLLAAQFPQWANLELEPVESAGTDNAIYRLGDGLAVRLPRVERATQQVDKEHEWLPRLAPHLPLAIPVPLARGTPGEGYPWHWSVCPWLEGENATIERVADLREAATDLALFVTALQRIDPAGGPPPGKHNFGRGEPLAQRDRSTREAIRALDGMLDTQAVTAAWEAALETPLWAGLPVWIHGDISPGNLLAVQGRLSAVIDFGCLGVGDPACDVMIAWMLLSGESREVFREALSVDDATWARGRGWALSWALIFIPYYLETNPVGVRHAWRTIEAVLSDDRSGS
jgi:aminoglycoside phosphotransferase (APT) family kinase protein